MKYFIQAPYDLYDNYWLANTINQIECAEEIAAYDEKRAARKFVQRVRTPVNKADRRKTRRAKHELAEKLNKEYNAQKWLQNHETNKFIQDVFAKKLDKGIELLKKKNTESVDFIAQRFVNKYKCADTDIAMRTLVKLEYNTKKTFTDWSERRMASSHRKYKEHKFARARAARRKYAQRTN